MISVAALFLSFFRVFKARKQRSTGGLHIFRRLLFFLFIVSKHFIVRSAFNGAAPASAAIFCFIQKYPSAFWTLFYTR